MILSDYYYPDNTSAAFNAVLDVSFSDEEDIDPISRETAKRWLRIDSVQDNIIIDYLIKAAREVCEKYLNQSLIGRTVTATINNTNGNIYLPYGPVKAITSFTNSNSTVLETSQYSLFGVQFKRLQWPCEDNLKIVYTAGYPEDCVPSQIKTGMLCQIAYMYEHRGDDLDTRTTLSPMAKSHLKSLRM